MEKETKELNQDTVHLLRALIKCSSAISNADDIIDSSVYKGNLKHLLPGWLIKYENHTKETMAMLTHSDHELLPVMIKHIEDLNDDVFIYNEERTNLFLFLVKIKSALIDLENIGISTVRDNTFMQPLYVMLERMISCIEGQYHYLKKIDVEGRNAYELTIGIINDMGKHLAFSEK